jgi:outer membrane PBP1 activator LpoA protein
VNELQDIQEKRLNTEKILQDEEEENTKLKATIEKLIRIREENAKLNRSQIWNMSKKNLTTKPTVHQNKTFTTYFIDIDGNISVDEPTIIKRTRNVLSNSPSSETAQPKTKGNAVEETNSEDEESNPMLDNVRITRVKFEKLTEYNQSSK